VTADQEGVQVINLAHAKGEFIKVGCLNSDSARQHTPAQMIVPCGSCRLVSLLQKKREARGIAGKCTKVRIPPYGCVQRECKKVSISKEQAPTVPTKRLYATERRGNKAYVQGFLELVGCNLAPLKFEGEYASKPGTARLSCMQEARRIVLLSSDAGPNATPLP
jgi:hypothetical protein